MHEATRRIQHWFRCPPPACLVFDSCKECMEMQRQIANWMFLTCRLCFCSCPTTRTQIQSNPNSALTSAIESTNAVPFSSCPWLSLQQVVAEAAEGRGWKVVKSEEKVWWRLCSRGEACGDLVTIWRRTPRLNTAYINTACHSSNSAQCLETLLLLNSFATDHCMCACWS